MREIEVGYAVVLREIIDQQATARELWLTETTLAGARERYLQRELRKLTAAAEKLTDHILDSK